MLLLVSVAHAAPVGPSALAGAGVEVAATASTQRAWLREPGCSGDGCQAWRHDALYGAEVGVGITKVFSLYAHGAWANERIASAEFTGTGYAVGGGARASIPLGQLAGVHAWVGLDQQRVAQAASGESSSALSVDAGAALRGGRPDEGFQAWIGAAVVPWSSQSATVLDGDVTVPLAPLFPVDAVAGLQITSEPLFGPWNDRSRMYGGVQALVGYHMGVTGYLAFAY